MNLKAQLRNSTPPVSLFVPTEFEFRRVASSHAHKSFTTVFVLLLLVGLYGSAQAAPGDFDRSFGSPNGYVKTDFFGSEDRLESIAIQPDGKIVAAGVAYGGGTSNYALARYNADGTPDFTFGSNGRITTDFFGGHDSATAVAIQPDGKIVVAGSATASGGNVVYGLARYHPNGNLDSSFGVSGRVTTAFFGLGDHAAALVILPDGRIIVAGSVFNGSSSDIALARYDSNGNLDSTFGNGGKVIATVPGSTESATGMAVQPSGNIIVCGITFPDPASSQFALVRFGGNGSFDTTFGTGGIVKTGFGGNDSQAAAVVVQQDSKIVVTGFTSSPSGGDIALARYESDGTLDSTFGTGGRVTTDFSGTYDAGRDLTIQPNGRIVVAGYTFNAQSNSANDFALARYNSNGAIDTTFGTNGKVKGPIFFGNDSAEAIALQPNGKIVAGGSVQTDFNNSAYDFVVARYEGDLVASPGNPDTSFDGDGKATTDFNGTRDEGNAVALQTDGKAVVAGSASAANLDFAVARYNVNGTLDSSFGTGGKVTTPVSASGDDVAYAVVIQHDGKIVVAGYAQTATTFDFALVRYNPNGTLDSSFGSGGQLTTDFGAGSDVGRALVLQADNKIVVAGYATIGSGRDFALARYNSNGSPDDGTVNDSTPGDSFGTGGKVTTAFGGASNNDEAYALVLQPDGKLVAAGYAIITGTQDFALARYSTNGSPDANFGGGTGRITTAFGSGADIAHALARQPDGKLVAAGSAVNTASGDTDFALARYTDTGILDGAFDGDGRVTSGTLPFAMNDEARAVCIQPDGKIVAAGFTIVPTINGLFSDFQLFRYRSDGSLDPTFGDGGRQVTVFNFFGNDEAHAIALQPNGRLVTAGFTTIPGGNVDFAVVRYYANVKQRSDFDGDYRSDIAVWRPADNDWYVFKSQSNNYYTQSDWGNSSLGDRIVPGDYDGDERTDFAFWRASESNWYIIQSTTNSPVIRNWGGNANDVPVPADYDGDRKTDLAVFRRTDGNWYILNSATNTATVRNWGISTDTPVAADYDGDGKADLAVFRSGEGNWYILNSSTNTATVRLWGLGSDRVVPADYDGDGLTDLAVFRPSESNWYIIQSATGTQLVKAWGDSGDASVPADYDQDGKADIAVWRPGEGNWYIIRSSTGAAYRVTFGVSGDVPVAAAYLPQ
jgi:uncharacterized delta-60 repeat protein